MAGCAEDPQGAKQKHLAKGDEYLAAGRLPEAIIEYRNSVQAVPNAGDARAKLAHAYAQSGDGGKALQEYVRAADLLPDDFDVQLKAASLQLLAGQFDEAKRIAEGMLSRNATHIDAQIVLANALAGLKDLNAAVAEIEEAIQLNPERGATYGNLGAFELSRGNANAAEQAFQRAVELDPASSTARLALANFFWVTSKWDAAERELQKAAELAPADPLPQRALASFLVAVGRVAEAEQPLKKVLDLTGTPTAAFSLAEYHIARGHEPAARAVLQPLAKNPRTAPAAATRLALLDFRTGHADAAAQQIRGVLAANPGNLDALLLKTEIELSSGNRDEALAAATQATEKHPESAAAFFALGRVQAARLQTDAAVAAYRTVLHLNPRATEAQLQIARLELVSGQVERSINMARDVVVADPKNLTARLTLVRALIRRGDVAQAETELTALASEQRDVAAVQVQLAALARLKNNPAVSRQHFDKALELDPSSIEALEGTIALDLAERRFDAVRTRVGGQLAQRPNDLAVLMLGARAYLALGDMQQGERLLRTIIDREPAYMAAYAALAQMYMRQGRTDAALEGYEEIARRQSRPVPALTIAGILLEQQGKPAQARERYERALALDPEAAVAANNLAWLLAHSGGNLDIALQHAQTASAKLPNVPEVADTLAVILDKKERSREAVAILKAVADAEPGKAIYQFHLGRAYARAGDAAAAREHLNRALALRSDLPEAAEVRALLAQLP
jgi:tetratricopeptide (TPR) repeat protein